jgi:hypothetical protein
MLSKIRLFVKKNKPEILLFLAVFLVSTFSFAYGYIIGRTQEKPPLEFHDLLIDEKNEEI